MELVVEAIRIGRDRWGSLEQAAEESGLSRATIRSRVITGKIQGYRLERLGWLVNIDSAIENNQTYRPGPKPKQEITNPSARKPPCFNRWMNGD